MSKLNMMKLINIFFEKKYKKKKRKISVTEYIKSED